jgi:hypothetical protein
MLTQKNCKAHAVLAILYDMMGEEFQLLDCEPYMNGREEGFCLKTSSEHNFKAVAFSENRNSDDIVIYCGEATDFSLQGNVPSEEIYNKKKYFQYHSYVEAAEYIRDYLISQKENKFRNCYHCEDCNLYWEEDSPYTNNDRCPKCNAEVSPTRTMDLIV